MSEMLATVYDPLIAPFDPLGVRRWREWVVREAEGRVLEIGIGTGLNLKYYHAAEALAAIDPDLASLHRARTRHHRHTRPVMLHQAFAEALPFATAAFDTVVGTLTFCSIGDPGLALREIRRVLKPGGTFRLVEHVRVENRVIAGWQDAVTPLWKRIAGNCHLNRDTRAAVERAGFYIRTLEKHLGGLFIGIDAVNP